MSIFAPCRATFVAGLFVAIPTLAYAQEAAPQPQTPGLDIVLTPGRGPQAIASSGSAITILRADDIEKAGVKSTADILRGLPGVSVTENGGPGQASTIRMRGAESRHTLVLIDGVRVNDPAGGNEFDFNTIVPADIERIEILRGPQSALYGSDAIGGVINVITRKGRGQQRGFAEVEGGRYGTLAGRAGISGGTRDFDYALSIAGARADGFSTYGYRIPRLALTGGRLEPDGYQRFGGSAKFGWRPTEAIEIEAGASSNYTRAGYDAAYGAVPDTESRATGRFTTAYVKGSLLTFDGRLKHSLSVFGNVSDRSYYDVSWLDFGGGPFRIRDRYTYLGQRIGVEYQGDLRLDAFGKLIFGARFEREWLRIGTDAIENSFNTSNILTARQQTRSLFVLHQLPVGERIDLSFGGRVDDLDRGGRIATWRTTAAYRLIETGTKFRASAGTGGKAPSLFQLWSPQYGTPGLKSERSVGVDVGIDQRLFNGALNLAITGFYNRLRNQIDFAAYNPTTFTYPSCPLAQAFNGCYQNIGRSSSYGIEASAQAQLIDNVLSLRASYTWLHATNLDTGFRLARRPEHEGRIALNWKATEALTIEPSVHLVGSRFSSTNEVYKLAPYVRFDVRADYQLHKNLNLYIRAENLTNARYQEVYNYGTTGRAVYAGARATW